MRPNLTAAPPTLVRLRPWMIAFGVVSLLDLGLTWLLVAGVAGAYEANPLAADILERFGWGGLALFKLTCVGVTLTAVYAVRTRASSRRLLQVACLASGAVVIYSLGVGYSAFE